MTVSVTKCIVNIWLSIQRRNNMGKKIIIGIIGGIVSLIVLIYLILFITAWI